MGIGGRSPTSTGVNEDRVIEIVSDVLIGDLPAGVYRVTTMYVDPETGKLYLEYEDTPTE